MSLSICSTQYFIYKCLCSLDELVDCQCGAIGGARGCYPIYGHETARSAVRVCPGAFYFLNYDLGDIDIPMNKMDELITASFVAKAFPDICKKRKIELKFVKERVSRRDVWRRSLYSYP
jgi:hypothetical protein